MKKHFFQIILLFLFGAFISNSAIAQKFRAEGDDCDNPFVIDVSSYPFAYSDEQTSGTCGHVNSYNSLSGGWSSGEDVVYKINVTEECEAKFTLVGPVDDLGDGWFSAYIYKGKPDSETAQPAEYYIALDLGVPMKFHTILEPNQDYYFVIDYSAYGEDDICLKEYLLEINFDNDFPTYYGLKILGTEVTDENAADLSGIGGVTSGEIAYDNDTKTLTLTNAVIYDEDDDFNGIYNSDIENLNVKLIGNNSITSTSAAFVLEKPTTISGTGTLTVQTLSPNDAGIFLSEAPLTIKNCTVTAIGDYGIAGNNGFSGEVLKIENATVKAKGEAKGSIADIQELTLTGCEIISPAGAAFDAEKHGVSKDNNIVKEEIVIGNYVAVTGVTLDIKTAELKIDETKQLTATVAPDNATNKNVSWKSSDATIATVENGLVTALKVGEASIIVTTEDGEKTDTCKVTVTNATVAVTGVILDIKTAELKIDETKQLTATVAPDNATNKNVSWKSSDATIATVENGLVTALKAGEASIIVTTEDGEKTDTCKVTVIENPTAVNDIAKSEFAVYPTVVENGFNIEVNANLVNSNLEVYNLLGVKVLSQKITAQKQYINISNLASGVYAVRLDGKTSKIVKK